MDLNTEEIWNGHAWALRLHAEKIGPMCETYDSYSSGNDLEYLNEIIKHAEWLRSDLKTRDPISVHALVTELRANNGKDMLSRIHELAAADPFKPFTIVMRHDNFRVNKKEDIDFTKSGSPKININRLSQTVATISEDHILEITQ